MEVFPVFFDMTSAKVAVFGTGQDAIRKVRLLRRTMTEIFVVGEPGPDWPHNEFPDVLFVLPEEAGQQLSGVQFAIISEPDTAGRDHAIEMARQHHVPINVVDNRGLSDFIIPSFVDKGKLVVAVSTSGAAPVIGRRIRALIELGLPDSVEEILALAASLRAAVRIRYDDTHDRRAFWDRFADAVSSGAIESGNEAESLRSILQTAFSEGTIEPTANLGLLSVDRARSTDCLTLGAFRFMQTCDVAIIEVGVGKDWIDLIRRDAERILVVPGRLPGGLAGIFEDKGPLSVLAVTRQSDTADAIEETLRGLDVHIRSLK